MPSDSTTAPIAESPDDGSAATPRGEGVSRPYVNDRLDSRINASLPEGSWEVKWRSDLASGMRPTFVLQVGDRILVQGADLWQLFTTKGEPIAVERMVGRSVVLDPSNGLVYQPDENGTFTAYALSDGTKAFILPLLFGSEFERVYFARRGNRIVMASLEQLVDLHEATIPEYALIEVQDLGNAASVDDLNFLTSSQLVTSLKRESSVLVAAMHEDRIVFSVPGTVEVTDLNLETVSIFDGDFTPLGLSLDDAGSIYLLVNLSDDEGAHSHALWMLDAAAEKTAETELPPLPATPHPPIVGPEGHVYLPVGDHILAINRRGRIVWHEHAGGPVAGAVVTQDDRLLVAADGILQSFTQEGEREILFFLEGGRFSTHPVLTQNGSLLVATDGHLYCLTIKKP